ncbi:MAG TPA: glycogen-binding domain-containing protein [Longimicrobiales bacterium]|nr:glycogen-binding domain-containing protein [Longimicrobiales bacterium]
MTDRIHAWLDGELPFEALAPEERDRARHLEHALDLVAESSAFRSPDLAAGVMARLADAPTPIRPLFARLRSAFAPGVLVLRPAAALAAACLVAGFGLGLWTASRAGGPAVDVAGPVAAGAPAVFVRFDLKVEDARTVHLAGSFSEWEPAYEMTPAADGHWTVTVPLAPGVHDYVFVVDGERQVLDPAAPRIADGFGTFNNRIALLASAT